MDVRGVLNIAGLFKCREGDFRIIYELRRKKKVIVMHEIAHCSEIYKKAKPCHPRRSLLI